MIDLNRNIWVRSSYQTLIDIKLMVFWGCVNEKKIINTTFWHMLIFKRMIDISFKSYSISYDYDYDYNF